MLRLQLANLGVTPSWYKKRGRDGVKAYLSASEMRELVGRLKVAAATRTKMRWGDAPPESPSDYAAMFWTEPPTKGRFPVASTLPAYFQSGLWSALTKAFLKVELFTYSKELRGVPKHESLTVVGAQELLGETTALSWLTCGAAIQHIADVIRLLAVNTRGGGWMLDGDQLWLRPPGPLPSQSGHVFHSMHAKWRVPFVDEPERFWRMKHCYRPMDQLWFASPWHFPKDSPILGPVLSELRCFFEKRKEQYTRGSTTGDHEGIQYSTGKNVAYNCVMRIVHAKIVETGLVCDILEPSAMSPIPYWRHDWFVCPTALQAPREENYHRIQSVADIMKSSIGVIPFLHSTKPNANAQRDSGTARRTTATVVAKGSLLHEVYSALGLELVGGKLPRTFWHGVVKIAPRREDAAGPVSGDVEPPQKRSKMLANTRGCGGDPAAGEAVRELSAQPRAAVATAAVESFADWSSFCKGDAGNIAVLQGPCDSAHTRGGGEGPSRDDAEMERALEEKRGVVLKHCDLAQFHAVVAVALRFWALVLKCGRRDYAPMGVWRDAVLGLALEFELPSQTLPSMTCTGAVRTCQAMALMCVGQASSVSAT